MASFSEALLAWYDCNGRHLPWRHPVDPYRVWLSEIMLQQTTVATVIPYFHRFLEKFPTVHALANASLEEVLFLWQGLGYYGRARRLWACAKELSQKGFPETVKGWQALPGIGAYTAAAVGAIAYEKNVMPVDANIHRIAARQTMLPVEAHHEDIKERLWTHHRFGDFVQAMMDLGSMVCKPRLPLCDLCPVRSHCLSYAHDRVGEYPPPKIKKEKPVRYQHALVIRRLDGALWLCQENSKGLLKGLYGVPLVDEPPSDAFVSLGHFWHVFTHFRLSVTVWMGTDTQDAHGQWYQTFDTLPFSTLMKKVLHMYATRKVP